jgi:hypothetical protein
MLPPKTFTIQVDRPRQIAFTQRALFRMGSLAQPFDWTDLNKPRKSYAALVAWLWACLVSEDAADFPTPEDLAVHVAPERAACKAFAETLADAINAGAQKKSGEYGSTPGPSPASS